MQVRLKPIMAVLFLSGLITSPVYAVVTDDAEFSAKEPRALMAEMSDLQREVKVLKRQVNTKPKLRYVSNTNGDSVPSASPRPAGIRANKPYTPDSVNVTNNPPLRSPTQNPGAPPILYTSPDGHPIDRNDLLALIRQSKDILPFDLDVPGQAFVSTGPYVGVPIQYAGSDLVINSPSVNTDVQLLGIRKSIYKQLQLMGGQLFSEPYHSHLLLSGVVEAQANYTEVGGGANTSDIDVTNTSLDAFFIGPSNWTLGFLELTYDSGPPAGSAFRVANSRLLINKAFMTIGDFTKSPVYGTVGQFYVPFGTYSSVMVSETLTKVLARTKARSILVGYQQDGVNALYGAVYIFRGDSHASSVPRVENGGLNIGYRFKGKYISGNFGGGVIANIADSGGMQAGNGFASFEQISHRVPAYNLRGVFSFGGTIDLIAEYVGTSTSFNVNDMSFNGRGAKPWAVDMEAAYSFYILDNKPSSVGIGYGHAAEALSLGIPMSRYSAVFTTSLWRNTLQSIELRHDRNYAASDTGNGPVGADTTPGACNGAACTASGKGDNAITLQFDYFF